MTVIEQKVNPQVKMFLDVMPKKMAMLMTDNGRRTPSARFPKRSDEPQQERHEMVVAAEATVVAEATAAFPAPIDFEVSAQFGGVNVLAWNYEGMNSLPEGMEYEVAVAVSQRKFRRVPLSPLPDDRKNHPETWHYTVRTRRNPLHHKATDRNGAPIGEAKGIVMWYCLRVVHGEQKGAWTPLVEVECNKWQSAPREPSRFFGLLSLFGM